MAKNQPYPTYTLLLTKTAKSPIQFKTAHNCTTHLSESPATPAVNLRM